MDKSAVKCNPDPYVLRLLAALGTGFDCASNGEISSVLSIGPGAIDPSRIIFANPCKATSFIRSAARSGVDLMTFDNTDELYKVARVHRGAKLVLRILTDDSKALCRLGLKFGAPLATVPALLAKAKELALDVVGVSFHVGSGCYDTDAFADAVRRARAAFDMGTEAGYTFSLLDVGGGFEDATFEATAGVLMRALDEYFPERVRSHSATNTGGAGASGAGWAMGMGGRRGEKGAAVRVIAEPGRFYVSQAFRLAANVIARRAPAEDDRDDGDDDDRGEVEEKNKHKKEGGVPVPAGKDDDDGDSPRVMCAYYSVISFLFLFSRFLFLDHCFFSFFLF
jgi:ornithine decarboxylase